MKKVIVFGGAGVGMSVAEIVSHDSDAEMYGFLNDVLEPGTLIGKFTKFPVLGPTEDYKKYLEDPDVYFTFAYSAMQRGENTYNKIVNYGIPGERFYSAIHPTAVIPEGFCKLGNGVIINALSQVGVDVEMADNTMLFANSYVGHDSVLDRFAHLATNAVCGAYCRIGKGVHVGMNAVIRENVTVGDFSLIGAGSVVLKDVPPKCIVVGNPAKILRYIDEEKPVQ